MEEGLHFSREAELNRYLFFVDYSDITFFVEDKDKEFEYEAIFSRLFHETYRIAIIAAGGKIGVLDAYKEFGLADKNDEQKKNFYLVDGDFDRYIHQQEMVINPQVIYLKYYNIEDYFLDEKAVLGFAKGKLHKLEAEVKNKVNYSSWFDKIIKQASKLFFLYCAVQNKLPGEINVGRNEYLFIDSKSGFEKEGAYEEYYDYIAKLEPGISDEIEEVKSKYYNYFGNDNYLGIVCGKFLLISLYSYLRGVCKVKFSKDELRWALVSTFNTDSLIYIKDIVDDICKA